MARVRRPTAPNSDVAGVYVRISDDRESEQAGVTRQEEDGTELAARLGLTVARVYSDNDTGASTRSRKPRPGYDALLADARAGRIGHIVAYSSSRLTRRPMELERQIRLAEEHGTRFVYVKSPSFDLNTADGRQVARMLAAADAAEAERTGERVSRAARQRAEHGGNNGGQRPYGFRPDGVTVDPAEAAVIQDAAGQALTGVSLRAIAADLNRRGVPTTTGRGRWSGQKLRDVLTKPRVAGLTVHDGVPVGRLSGDPILTEDAWRALVEVLTDPGRRVHNGRPQKWLGSGILRCVCGAPMEVGSRQAYRCTALRTKLDGRPAAVLDSQHAYRNAPGLDAFLADLVVARLSRPDAADLFTAPTAGTELPDLRREAAQLRARKTRLAAMLGTGELDDAEYAAAARANRERLSEVEARIAATADTSPLAPLAGAADVRAAWDRLSLGQRRAIVAELLTVTVHPAGRTGRGFRPDGIEITWRAS